MHKQFEYVFVDVVAPVDLHDVVQLPGFGVGIKYHGTEGVGEASN